ncbi:MAG: transglycosylase SLT domain-containing protein [Candidatus Promineifilaceae bacterium]
MRRKLKIALIAAVLCGGVPLAGRSAQADERVTSVSAQSEPALSPYWGEQIRRWAAPIARHAAASGLDADFVAAVMQVESNGNPYGISYAGAVGLMGVMPSGPGLEWRPRRQALLDPELNLTWGVAILKAIMRQSGGDVVAALAAYNGGWAQVDLKVPRQYAAHVLDLYGRAVAMRAGVSPAIASTWTMAVEIERGNIPQSSPILGDTPVSGLRRYGERIIFVDPGREGPAYFVRGYAVPLALVVPLEDESDGTAAGSLDRRLLARLGPPELKIGGSNPAVLLACLPSLARLRGHQATRWYAPAGCPDWHR